MKSIERVVGSALRILLKTGKPAHVVAKQILTETWEDFSTEDRQALALTGLQKLISDKLKNSRYGSGANRKDRSTTELDTSKNALDELERGIKKVIADEARRLLDGIVLQGAEGRMVSLLRFSKDDVLKCKEDACLQEVAWSNRSMWFSEAEMALIRENCSSIDELSPSSLSFLAERAQVAWVRVR